MFREELDILKKNDRYRTLEFLESAQEPQVKIGGKEYILFCSNNYLGLANDSRIHEKALTGCKKYGFSSGASRLLSGSTSIHKELEEKLADFSGTESTILFGTGYQANCGVIPLLAGPEDLILSDELNHASIIDGCRLSRAKKIIFKHRSLEDLSKNLEKHSKEFRKKIILTEGVFSMEGTLAPLDQYWQIAQKYQAFLYIDDAHGIGVLGYEGRGSLNHFHLPSDHPRIIQLGTLGKALGSFGAFIGSSKEFKELIINKCRTFIFSTALPPIICFGVLEALRIIKNEPLHFKRLQENCFQFSKGLASIGLEISEMADQIPIQPVKVGDEKRSLSLAKKLWEEGIFARAIRPPTVSSDQCRIRFSLMATHKKEQIDYTLSVLKKSLDY